jgi:hypothetical protein
MNGMQLTKNDDSDRPDTIYSLSMSRRIDHHLVISYVSSQAIQIYSLLYNIRYVKIYLNTLFIDIHIDYEHIFF